MAEIFGVIGGFLNTIRLLPQVYKSVRTKKTADLSGYFILILFLQSIFLILYGLTKPDILIVYMNIVPLLCATILIFLKIKYS
jgi:MtN3 and saliva related transmembrane protein